MTYSEPTADECSQHAKVCETDEIVAYALWYPQMGGYRGSAIAEIDKRNGCVDVYVWHDGEFPFGDESPKVIHHCDASQFIEFGQLLLSLKDL